MQKFAKFFSWFVILLYFVLGVYVLVSPRFQHLPKEIKYIFAIFLFLYGAFRLARIWTKSRERNEE
ncbi:MAG: C4-dicarboxylate ABC transporter [Bacteroidota bacterium]